MITTALLFGSAAAFASHGIAAPSEPGCHPEKLSEALSKNPTAFFSKGADRRLATTDRAQRLLESLQFKRELNSVTAANARPENLGPCDARKAPRFYSKEKNPFTLVLRTSCGIDFAKKFGFKPFDPAKENFGSMQTGILVQEDELFACNDGSRLAPCSQLREAKSQKLSRSCWDAVFKTAKK